MIIGTQTLEAVVYKITNLISGRYYIGVSTRFLARMREHGKQHKKILADIEKFDLSYEDNFDKEIIFQGTEDECYALEEELVPEDKSKRPYYNSMRGGKEFYSGSGENSINTKISNKDVEKARNMRNSGDTLKKIAKRFNLSETHISDICARKERTEAKGPITPKLTDMSGENNPTSKLKNTQAKEIRMRCLENGEKSYILADEFKVDISVIYDILSGKKYSDAAGPIRKKSYTNGRKISYSQALAIKIRGYMTMDSYGIISDDYSIEKTAITNIIKGYAWKEVIAPTLGIDYKMRGEGGLDKKLIRRKHNNPLGEDTFNSKLSNIEAMEIRYLYAYADGYTQTILSKLYNIASQNISNIILGKTYKNSKGPIQVSNKASKGVKNGGSKIKNEKDIQDIRIRCYMTRDTYVTISKDYPISPEMISEIARGKSWKDAPGPILGPNGDYQKRGEGSE